jgi:hypothetical protein
MSWKQIVMSLQRGRRAAAEPAPSEFFLARTLGKLLAELGPGIPEPDVRANRVRGVRVRRTRAWERHGESSSTRADRAEARSGR